MKRISKIFAVIISAALLLCSCGKTIDPPPLVSEAEKTDLPPIKEPYPVSFDDETFEASPMRVVSLSPALTEIMADLGLFDRLCAVSDYCDYPEAAASLTKAGSPASPDIDGIISLSPELVITMSPIASTDLILLRQAGARVLEISPPQSFAGLCEIYIKLSMLFYGAVDFQAVAEGALSGLDSAMSAASELGISRSFVIAEGECEGGLLLSNGAAFCSSVLSVFGYNLRLATDPFTATEDELFELAPDIVFYSDEIDRDRIDEEFPHSELVPIDFERFERPTARIAEVVNGCTERLR